MGFKSGFVSIIGRPNAGKSTLLNALLNQKLAITCDKAQTTRDNIQGILNSEEYQIIFTDTPGIHKPHHALGRNMNKGVYSAMQDVDVIYYIVDATKSFGRGDEFVLEKLANVDSKVFLLLNKIDLVPKEKLINLLDKWQHNFDFAQIIPISALNHENLKRLIDITLPYLKSDFPYYPNDMVSDRPVTFRIKEIIREKVLNKTQEEVPHSVAVVLDEFKEMDNKAFINATIIVERDSQKGIIIGKQGNMIKSIRLAAQKELKLMLNKKVVLELYVRVEKKWRDNEAKLKNLGYSDIDE